MWEGKSADSVDLLRQNIDLTSLMERLKSANIADAAVEILAQLEDVLISDEGKLTLQL